MKDIENMIDSMEIETGSSSEAFSSSKEMHFEQCVLCGAQTHIPKGLRISQRCGYIEGVGQLCMNCFRTIRGKDK